MTTHQFTGVLQKMKTQLLSPVNYTLSLGEDLVDMNTLIQKKISIVYHHQIICMDCGKLTKKSYAQGYCYTCMMESPDNSECIIHPEKCEGHLGKGRDVEWESDHHVKDHYVYLANSGGLKVGVTRSTQVPTRWIDQGATQAVIIAKVPYRKLAGLIEVELKKHVSDKTNWQMMLTNQSKEPVDLLHEAHRLIQFIPESLNQYCSLDFQVQDINFPVKSYPVQINSMNLEKTPEIEGILCGIKGQYLIFEGGSALNIRNHSAYKISLSYED